MPNGKKPSQDQLPTKPTGLPTAVAICWDELIDQLPHDVLQPIDAHELTILARLIVQADQLAVVIDACPADLKSRRTFLQTVQQVPRLSSVFGLNPSDRARLGLDSDQDEVDPFLMYINGE